MPNRPSDLVPMSIMSLILPRQEFDPQGPRSKTSTRTYQSGYPPKVRSTNIATSKVTWPLFPLGFPFVVFPWACWQWRCRDETRQETTTNLSSQMTEHSAPTPPWVLDCLYRIRSTIDANKRIQKKATIPTPAQQLSRQGYGTLRRVTGIREHPLGEVDDASGFSAKRVLRCV